MMQRMVSVSEILQALYLLLFVVAIFEIRLINGEVEEDPVELFNDICSWGLDLSARPNTLLLTDYGAVNDGVTLNTDAFQRAIASASTFAETGGAMLYVPPGKWLTGSFNLTSHMTLFLAQEAAILGSEDPTQWPLIDPLPSYGRGRERPGRRHSSLINGNNLTDVIITGENGTIDGQGAVWWKMFNKKTLNHTRGHLIELIDSQDVLISNLTFLNSPFWNIHPVYCRNIAIRNVTILAPHDSPNTDGIDPDSSTEVCMEDIYVSNGDDIISIKSGWDEYGIQYGRPSSNITIRNVVGDTHSSAGISIGSEMSGGVSNVYATDIVIYNARRGIHVKTSPGRGGYVKDVYIRNMRLIGTRTAIGFSGEYGEHPDNKFDPNALPYIERIFISNITGENIKYAGELKGIAQAPFQRIGLFNIDLTVSNPTRRAWNCSYVEGYSTNVSPLPCAELCDQQPSPVLHDP